MNKMSQDKLFMIILVSVFTAGLTFLGALKFSNVGGEEHHEAPVAQAGGAPAGEHH